MTAGDVDEHALGTPQADFIEERVGNCLFCGLDGAVFAAILAGAHHRFAHLVHHGAHIGKVEVDQAGTHHQIGYTLDALIEHVVGHAERFGEGRLFIRQTEQVLVGDDDQRVDHLLQRLDTLFCLTHPLGALELERLGDNTNRQHAQFPRGLRDDRGCTCPGAAPHARGDKAHMRTRQVVNDLLDALFGGGGPDRRPRPGPQTLGHFDTQLDTAFRVALAEGLRICVCHHEIHTIETLLDHVVHGVATCPTHTENGDTGLQLVMSGHSEVECHSLSACPDAHIRGLFSA